MSVYVLERKTKQGEWEFVAQVDDEQMAKAVANQEERVIDNEKLPFPFFQWMNEFRNGIQEGRCWPSPIIRAKDYRIRQVELKT